MAGADHRSQTLLSDFGVGANPDVDPVGVTLSNTTATAIPTLSEWTQIGMAALLVGGGVWAMRKGRLKADG